MKKAVPIFKRELLSFLASPMGYIILAVYIFVIAWFFNNFLASMMDYISRYGGNIAYQELRFADFLFSPITMILLLIAPVLTMRAIAEEKSTGTIQLLLTSPVTDAEVIIGKFMAAFTFFATMIAASVAFPIIMNFTTSALNWGQIMSGYLGLLLLAALFCACGVFISSLVESQVVAAVVSLAFLIFCNWIIGLSGRYFPGRVGAALSYFSFETHYKPFIKGVIGTEHVIFFLTSVVLFLFLSVKSLEKRKWSNLLEDDNSRKLFTFDPFWTGALFLWGLFLLLFIIMPAYDRISMILLVLGCVMAMIWVITKRTILHDLFKSRRGLAGANVVLSTIVVLVIYVIVSISNHEFNTRWDVTFDKIESLSSDTRQLIDRMQVDVDIMIFNSRHRAPKALEWYGEYSSKISVLYLDPVNFRAQVEQIAREVGQQTLQDYIIVRGSNDPLKDAHLINLKKTPSVKILETEIDQKLLAIRHKAEKTAKKKVYFLTGHGETEIDNDGEAGISKFANLLGKEYIEVSKLFLLSKEKIPSDCDLLIIAGPDHRVDEDRETTDTRFAPEEIRILEQYLNKERRNLLVLAGPEFSRTDFSAIDLIRSRDPRAQEEVNRIHNTGGLQQLLAMEGFILSNGVIFHPQMHLASDNSVIYMEPLPGNVITQQKQYQLFVPMATPVFFGREAHAPFLRVPPDGWIESRLKSDGKFHSGKEAKEGEQYTAAFGYSSAGEGLTDRRIVVIGSSAMATNQYIDLKDNRKLLRDTVNWMLNKENFSISRDYTAVTIAMSKTTKDAIFYVSTLVLPFLFLAVAILVWWDRR